MGNNIQSSPAMGSLEPFVIPLCPSSTFHLSVRPSTMSFKQYYIQNYWIGFRQISKDRSMYDPLTNNNQKEKL